MIILHKIKRFALQCVLFIFAHTTVLLKKNNNNNNIITFKIHMREWELYK